MIADAAVIGGGPAGAAVARLLASWGHRVCLLTRPPAVSRGLAESLPPSTYKLLQAIGVADAVDAAGFYRSSGNTVWWASRERRVELFGASGQALGYQVFRPSLDRVLLDCARSAGADVLDDATVRRVSLHPDRADLQFDTAAGRRTASSRMVIDASGRAGILAKRYRRFEAGHRTYALVGVWRRDEAGQDAPRGVGEENRDPTVDPTHTLVETYDDGWAWSVPISPAVRHVGLMTNRGPRPHAAHAGRLAADYRAELAMAAHIAEVVRGAALERVFACDASLYSSTACAGPRFLLVGDAASFIDPLSSFGVKKALASAWVGAVAAHTALTYPDRGPIAIDFFTRWEQQAYAAHLRRSGEFARAAHAEHAHAFWALRATEEDTVVEDNAAIAGDPAVRDAFERLKAHDAGGFAMGRGDVQPRPVIRGHEIALADTFGGLRFFANVDLVQLAEVACRHRRVPDVFEAYCAAYAPVPLPNLVGALSLLVAKGILVLRV